MTAAGSVRTIRIDRSRASALAPAAVQARHVHGAMRATMMPSRGRRRPSKLNLIKRAGVIENPPGVSRRFMRLIVAQRAARAFVSSAPQPPRGADLRPDRQSVYQ